MSPLLFLWLAVGLLTLGYFGTRPEKPSLPDHPSRAERARRAENRRLAEHSREQGTRRRDR